MRIYKKIISPIQRTRGQVEDDLAKAFVQFYVKNLGGGPKSAKVYIVADMIIARLKGNLHPLEEYILKGTKDKGTKGIELVKNIRKAVQEATFEDFNKIIKSIVGCSVVSYHSDSSTRTGERFEIFIVDKDLGKEFEAGA